MKPHRLETHGEENSQALIAYRCASGAEAAQPGNMLGTESLDWDADHLVLYKDGENAGWYIAFNTRLGTCFHLMFLD